MAYVANEDLKRAREMDLLTYKQSYEPWDLVKLKDGYYQLKSHDSLKINYHNGKWLWNWWSQGVGGRSALDYLTKVEGMSLVDAVGQILGQTAVKEPVIPQDIPKEKEQGLYIPERSKNKDMIYDYLCNQRGIDREIVKDFVDRGEIYLTNQHANIAFVGHDAYGNVKLVALRGTKGEFKNTTAGSNRRFPFQARAEDWDVRNSVVHLFEAPIDMLSYATLMKQMGVDYKSHNMIALCGIYKPRENLAESKIPVALQQHFNELPYTNTVCLHLDNDGPGKLAARALSMVLQKDVYKVYNQPPPEGYKDCNDYLKNGAPITTKAKEERQVIRSE